MISLCPLIQYARLGTLLLAAVLACGEGSGPTAPRGGNGTGTITPSGGTVTLGFEAGVIVPAGAVDGPVTITIERVATPADLEGEGATGQAYRFSPTGLLFAAPVEIFVHVPETALEGFDPNSVALHLVPDPVGAPSPAGVERLGAVRREPAPEGGGLVVRGTTTHFSIVSATANPLPTADAGPDRTVAIGVPVEVVGVGVDPAGGAVTLGWSLVEHPEGSAASLSQTAAQSATFTPDVAGAYLLRLTVTNANGTSVEDDLTITATTSSTGAPAAQAGPDRRVAHGALVSLDGSASTGTAPLSFSWRFLSFPGSRPTLSGGSTATPSFTPGTGGTYILELTVTNGVGSGTDNVTITVNSPPVAQVSAPTGVMAGDIVTLIDTSTDPDGDPLTASWSLVAPSGSSATIVPAAGRATFVTDVIGGYDVDLTVSDGLNSTTVGVQVGGVPDVSGVYASALVIDPAPTCGLEEAQMSEPGELPITQTGDRITLRVSQISDGQASDISGPIRHDASFDFIATMQVATDGQTFTISPRWMGNFLPSGELSARFTVTVLSCTLTGSLEGTKL